MGRRVIRSALISCSMERTAPFSLKNCPDPSVTFSYKRLIRVGLPIINIRMKPGKKSPSFKGIDSAMAIRTSRRVPSVILVCSFIILFFDSFLVAGKVAFCLGLGITLACRDLDPIGASVFN
jgi:hypothetical protein